MLKVKFWRIDNIVLMKILEQGDEIKRGCEKFFISSDGVILSSQIFPQLCDEVRVLCVRGLMTECDNSIEMMKYETVEEAKRFYNLAKKAIEEYNASLTTIENEPIYDDIEIDIVG